MAVADMIPTLDDKGLASLHDNARRLETTAATEGQRKAATELLPLIKAELAAREALKPPKKTAKKAAPKKVKAPKKTEAEPAAAETAA